MSGGQEPAESRMRAKGGVELLVRAIRPSDEDHLRDAFNQLSQDTIRRRFFHARKELPPEEARAFASPDFDTEVALVAVDDSGPDEQIVAGGRYFVEPGGESAELAFTVRDDWQGRGVGTYIFKRLLAIGRSRGVARFVALVESDNTPMVELIRRHAPGPVQSRREGSVLELTFDGTPGESSGS